VDDERLGVVAVAVEVAEQGSSEPAGVARPAVLGGVHDDGDQGCPFGIEPASRLRGTGQRRNGAGRPGDAGAAVRLGRVQGVHRDGGGIQVVVEQAGQRDPPFLLRVKAAGQFAAVGAQQIMQAVAARPGGLDQVRAVQLAKPAPGLRQAGPGERCGGVGVEVGPGVQAQQPERPGGTAVQVPVGPGEHRPHGGARIPAGIEQVQPLLLIGQPGGQLGERYGRAAHGELGGYPQGQRQAAALSRQRGGRVRLIIDPPADQRPQQANRVLQRQQVQVQAGRPVPGDQPG
jgi:hypothetical protein